MQEKYRTNKRNVVLKTPNNFNVEIVSVGHANTSDPRFEKVSIRESINRLSEKGREDFFKTSTPSQETIDATIKKYMEQVGHETRPFFNGNLHELGMLSVTDCLKKGEILPYEIDKFSFVSNTLKRNEGYSSQADKVMYKLSEMYPGLTGISEGYATFSQEACSIAVISIIENAWLIHSGLFKSSLVTASELATTLSHPDDFRNHNLFGDASGSVFLRQGKRKSILATGIKTHPYPTKGDPNKKAIDLISQREDGYLFQDGPEVYKWVNGTFVKELKQSFEEIDFDFTQLDHCIFHQPSYKVTKSLREKIYEQWTGFKGHIYWDKNAGNTSSASTLSLLSRLIESGEIKKGNKVLVSSFGAGLTWAFFIYEY